MIQVLPKLADLAAGLDTDKESRHGYLSGMYERVLAPYRVMTSRILEIGVYHGGSIMLWRDAFPHAVIHGADIAEVPPNLRHMHRTVIHQFDAYDPVFVSGLPYMMVIIDDGPHTLESHQAFIRLYKNRLSPGGVMVIEDIPNEDHFSQLTPLARDCGFIDCEAVVIPGKAEDSRCLILR